MIEHDNRTRIIDKKIDSVLNNPQGWGGIDALEPLVLMLLMLRAELSATSSPRDVVRRYRKFLAERIHPGAGDIRERLGNDLSLKVMVEVLREHVDDLRAHKPLPVQIEPIRRHGFPRFQSIEQEVAL